MKFSKALFLEYFQRPSILINRAKINRKMSFSPIKYGDHPQQYFLSYIPKKITQKEVICFIHSGSWTFGSPKGFRFVAKKFRDLGYPVILLGYRRMPHAHYKEIINDIFIGFNAAKKHIFSKTNLSNFNIIGASAGAHLGALLVYDSHLQHIHNTNSSDFKRFCSIAGPLSFNTKLPKILKRLLFQLFVERYHFVLGNPIVHANRTNTKVLCIHSKKDPLCPYEQSLAFTKKLNNLKLNTAKLETVTDKDLFHSSLIHKLFLDSNCIHFGVLKKWLIE